MTEDLKRLLNELRGMKEETDFEETHFRADMILLEVIDLLAKTQSAEIVQVLNEIKLNYDDLFKWYA